MTVRCVGPEDCINYARDKLSLLVSLFAAAGDELDFSRNGISGLFQILSEIEEHLEGAEFLLDEERKQKRAPAKATGRAEAPSGS